MRRHGLISTVQADDLTQRSTGPIADLVTLGSSPEVSRQLLLELVMRIEPSVRMVEEIKSDEDRADQGPMIMWLQTCLARERVEFHNRDVAYYGPFRCGRLWAIQHLRERRPSPCYGGQYYILECDRLDLYRYLWIYIDIYIDFGYFSSILQDISIFGLI